MCLDQSFKCLDLVLEHLYYIAVIFVSDFSSFSKKPFSLIALTVFPAGNNSPTVCIYARMGYEEDDADADQELQEEE